MEKIVLPVISRRDGGGAAAAASWPGVVRIGDGNSFGSGVLLASGVHILTAAHVVDDLNLRQIRVYFETMAGVLPGVSVLSVTLHPLYFADNTGIWHDLALITLKQAAPVEAKRYSLHETQDEVGRVVALVGYGVGLTSTGVMVNEGRPLRREGLNTIDATGADLVGMGWRGSLVEQLWYDYDDGSFARDTLGALLRTPHLGLGDREAITTPGDSGGGVFIETDGEWLLAGVHSAVTRWSGSGQPKTDMYGVPGDIGVAVRVSSYLDWIYAETGQVAMVSAQATPPPDRSQVPMAVAEGRGVYFLVEVAAGARNYASVDYFTRDGTARVGLDYIGVNGTVTFSPGDSWAKVWVQTLADNLLEGNETFFLVLTNPVGASFPVGVEELTAMRTIVDDVSLIGVTELYFG